MTDPSAQTDDKRAGFVALIGAPNSGKSTLLNALVGAKVAIVTHKVQTTRTRLLGIAMAGRAQLIFVDTPGIFTPKRRLDRAMVDAAWKGAEDADITCLLIDAKRGIEGDTERIVNALRKAGRKVAVILNKIDIVKKPQLLKLADQVSKLGIAKEIFMISALTEEGVGDLTRWLSENVPEGPWLYPEDQMADITERLMAAELTREQIYLRLHQELPYSLSVETTDFKEQDDGSIRIEQTILVAKKSQKGIVIGKGGQALKAIGEAARKEMQRLFETRVHLFLFVKVAENWSEDRSHYREIGLPYVD